MKNGSISEFDKVYIVKYIDIIGERQMIEDLKITKEQLKNTIDELKKIGLYAAYYKLSDEEWENISRISYKEILLKYSQRTKSDRKIFKEVIEAFKKISIVDTIMKFPLYNYTEQKFKFDYFKQEDYENEEWKEIEEFNYSVSNYRKNKKQYFRKNKGS